MKLLNIILGGLLLFCSGCAHQKAKQVEKLGLLLAPEEAYANGRLLLTLKVTERLTQGNNIVVCILTNVTHVPISLPLWFKDETQPNIFVWLKRETDSQYFYCTPKILQNNALFENTTVEPREAREIRGEFVISAPPGKFLMFCKLVSCKDVYSNQVCVEVLPGANFQKTSKSL